MSLMSAGGLLGVYSKDFMIIIPIFKNSTNCHYDAYVINWYYWSKRIEIVHIYFIKIETTVL